MSSSWLLSLAQSLRDDDHDTLSLIEFCSLLDPKYEAAEHLRKLCAHLEALERGEIERLAVFMPPRHGKTLTVSERFPAWWLGRHPEQQIILASYGAELAEQASRRVRNAFEHPNWPYPSARVTRDSSAVNRWGTTAGGVVIAAGVGGAATGFGAHLLVIDDPVKGRAEADSQTYRDRAWEWWTEVARTRLMPGGRAALCQTRWHEDDLAGRILNSSSAGQWTVLSLPALNDQGEALWPGWFPATELRKLQTELGSRAWEALYQQRPSADEGGWFKRAWFARRYADLPEGIARPIAAIDAAYKTGIGNDYSAIATWARAGNEFFLIDLWRERVEFPDLRRAILEQYAKHRHGSILIEDSASGQSIIQELRRETMLPIVPIRASASKEARASAVTPLCEAGRVRLPNDAPWLREWLDEHAAFPTGAHDDQVDTTSMALARLSQIGRLPAAGTTSTVRTIKGPKSAAGGQAWKW